MDKIYPTHWVIKLVDDERKPLTYQAYSEVQVHFALAGCSF